MSNVIRCDRCKKLSDGFAEHKANEVGDTHRITFFIGGVKFGMKLHHPSEHFCTACIREIFAETATVIKVFKNDD